MEFFLKHWDGYAGNTNNTYIYNDVKAVAAPGVDNIKFKMIPWGIDQTFQPDRRFKMATTGWSRSSCATTPHAVRNWSTRFGPIGTRCSAARLNRRR